MTDYRVRLGLYINKCDGSGGLDCSLTRDTLTGFLEAVYMKRIDMMSPFLRASMAFKHNEVSIFLRYQEQVCVLPNVMHWIIFVEHLTGILPFMK